MDLGVVAGLRRESAIGAGDDVVAPDQLGPAHQPFGDQLRMFHDVDRVRDDAGHDRLALGQLDAFEHVVIVLVARIGGLEGIDAGIDAQHVLGDVAQLRLEHARAVIDAVAGVEAHLLGRDAAQRVVDAFDEDVGLALLLLGVERVVAEHVGEERIVDLEVEAGLDDGEIFGAHRLAHRVEEFLVGFEVLVEADAARRGRGHEGADAFRRVHRLAQIGEIALDLVLADIADRTAGEQRHHRRDIAARHRLLEILLVIFGERVALLGIEIVFAARPRLDAGEALLGINEEPGLRGFAVADDIDAALGLLLDDFGNGTGHALLIGRRVELAAFAGELRFHHVEQVGGARQAADMADRNAIGRAKHLFSLLREAPDYIACRRRESGNRRIVAMSSANQRRKYRGLTPFDMKGPGPKTNALKNRES